MTVQPDRSFDADYDVEPLSDLPSALDYDFHEPDMAPKSDLLLSVTTGDGSSWTGGVRAGGPSVGSPSTGIYTTPNKNTKRPIRNSGCPMSQNDPMT